MHNVTIISLHDFNGNTHIRHKLLETDPTHPYFISSLPWSRNFQSTEFFNGDRTMGFYSNVHFYTQHNNAILKYSIIILKGTWDLRILCLWSSLIKYGTDWGGMNFKFPYTIVTPIVKTKKLYGCNFPWNVVPFSDPDRMTLFVTPISPMKKSNINKFDF